MASTATDLTQFRVLGPLEVLAHGEPLALGGQKQRALLALLLLRANRIVSTDELVEALWGETPPRTAVTSLQNSISALRKLLGPEAVETTAGGYRLVLDEDGLDAARFERLVASARELEPAERAERLREALALWRGEPLRDLGFESFGAAELRRLEELRLEALEERLAAELACGLAAELVPELEELVSRHPLRERLRAQLMLALYRAGRQADALRAYQDARHELAEELGLEPGPELQELHAAILRHEVPRPRLAEAAADEEHLAEVAACILAGRVVPVLGTDLGALASGLEERFGLDDGGDLARVAQFVALTKGPGPLQDELHALLGASGAPAAVHRFFAALPPLLRDRGLPHQLLVTTGYDLALEQALLEAGEEFDVVAYVPSGRDRGRFCHREPGGATHVIDVPNTYARELSLERRTVVLKLDGGLEDDGGVAVTEDDFIGYLARTDAGAAIPVGLVAKLRRSHFLFLGYGMREWSLRLVLDRLWDGEPLAYRSWAVAAEPRPLERQFWQARNVDLFEQSPEEYVTSLGRHLGLAGEAEP